jgi:hypothetical protein
MTGRAHSLNIWRQKLTLNPPHYLDGFAEIVGCCSPDENVKKLPGLLTLYSFFIWSWRCRRLAPRDQIFKLILSRD